MAFEEAFNVDFLICRCCWGEFCSFKKQSEEGSFSRALCADNLQDRKRYTKNKGLNERLDNIP